MRKNSGRKGESNGSMEDSKYTGPIEPSRFYGVSNSNITVRYTMGEHVRFHGVTVST